ncbi:hypothetical protein [Acidipropionibacterium jensenii]|uniref:hypothetical protein n=3 Tax=Acidipropionibacterium jensenii TaxID=1749 RepID=UPI002647C2F8|nr:hypothetical protein [Acidipropionibacterium jensenii]
MHMSSPSTGTRRGDDHPTLLTGARDWLARHQTVVMAVLIGGAIVLAVIPRWTQLGAQSVWSDEQFTLSQTSGGLTRLRDRGHTEIHTPFFAMLVWLWNHIVSVGAVRARAFSALVTTLGIACVPLMLRRTPIPAPTRWLLTAAVATSGLGFVYGQEIRPYGLLWALAVALTVSHLRLEWEPRTGGPTARRQAVHLGLGVLASLTHLFGLVLAGCSLVVLVARGRMRPLRGLLFLAVVCLPEAIWIIHGRLTVPGFAAGTSWNARPDLSAVTLLLQSVFSWGVPSMTNGGFVWHTPAGPALVIVVLTVALNRYWRRSASSRGTPSPPAISAATGLALLAVLIITSSWLVSQITPLWTPRNLIVVDPVIRIALGLLVVSVPGRPAVRTLLSSALVIVLTAGLATVVSANRSPWKTDFRAAVRLAMATRHTHPEVRIAGNLDPQWAVGTTSHPDDPRTVAALTPDRYVSRLTFPSGVRLADHDTLWLMYLSPQADTDSNTQIMINTASPSQCHPIAITGILAMYCTARAK